MPFKILVPLASAALALAGCGAAITKDVSISLRYVPSSRAPAASAARIDSVGLGAFTDARSGRPAGAAGERVKFDSGIDRFRPRGGVPEAARNIVRDYFTARKIRVLDSGWRGVPGKIWGEKGEIVISARVLKLWFSATDSITMAEASSVFQIELKAGSPKSGAIITKTIQIEPKVRRNIFWEAGDVERWLSESISEALDRILPDIERRLAG
jgi:hypothetical protein